MREEETDTLAIVRSADGLGEGGRNVNNSQLLALLLLFAQRHRVGDDDPREDAVVENVDGVTAENAVGDNGHDLGGAILREHLGGLGQGAAGIGHVVDQDGDLVSDVSHQHHAANDVGTRALLVNESKALVETIGYRGGALGTTGIGTDNDNVLVAQVLLDPSQDTGLSIQVVDGDVEEALDLTGVQVHGNDMVASGRDQHVGNELGGYGRSALVLLVLSGIGKVGENGGDAAGAGGATGVDHDEELHQAVVDVVRGRGLQNEDVLVSDRLADRHRGLLIRIVEAHGLCDLDAEPRVGERIISATRTF